MKKLLLLPLLLCSLSALAGGNPLHTPYPSPDKNIYISVFQQKGQTWYNILLFRQVLMDQTTLGLDTEQGSFYKDLKVKDVRSQFRIEHLRQPNGRTRRYTWQQVVYQAVNPAGQRIDIVFRLTNDCVAYCYRFPGQTDSPRILKEYGETYTEPTLFKVPEVGWIQMFQSDADVHLPGATPWRIMVCSPSMDVVEACTVLDDLRQSMAAAQK